MLHTDTDAEAKRSDSKSGEVVLKINFNEDLNTKNIVG